VAVADTSTFPTATKLLFTSKEKLFLEHMINMADEKDKASSLDASRSQDEGIMTIPDDPDAHLTAAEKAEVVS
jgi:hypothetical protein